ncbi:protocadherin Fat 4, partial [Mytilus galloprovincialis]
LGDDPDKYIADTKINGILGGTDPDNGIRLEISRSSGTPFNINVTTQFSLESRAIIPPENTFSQRAFLRLISSLDRDGQTATTFDDTDVIEFQVKCTRVGSASSTFFLMTVDVQDTNDNSPVFSGTPYEASVNELSPIGTTVFRGIAAFDLDANTNKDINFGIMPGDGGILDGSQKFEIATPRLGYVSIRTVLDFEALNALGQTTYILNISATDQATDPLLRKTTYETLRLNILDGDDLGPVFVLDSCLQTANNVCFHPTYTTEITNGVIGGILTLRPGNNQAITTSIAAQDQDTLNAAIGFTIEETIPSGYANRFAISGSANSGKLYTASLSQVQAINRNTVQDLEIIIKATENTPNARFSRAIIKATIVRANNNPPVVSVSSVNGYINENSPIGTAPTSSDGSTLLRVTVTDGDLAPGEQGQYTLTVEGTTDFIVTPYPEGYIKLNINNLNYENSPNYLFTVRATEVGTASPRNGDTNVNVIVRDLNDNTPTFTSPSYATTTAEQDYANSPKLLVTVSATDDDSTLNGDIKFSIESVTNGGMNKFYITKNSGSTATQTAFITVNGSVVEGENYVIIVKAEDSALEPSNRRISTVPVSVEITGTGTRPPVIPASVYSLSISEGIPVGTSIFKVDATDPEGSALIYAITSGNNNGDFSINPNNGEILTAKALNREATPSYSIGLQVTDNTPLSDTATLQITITDVNDVTPVFDNSIYNFNVNEGLQPPANVGIVKANDSDAGPNGQIQYSIAPNSNTNSANLFTINANSGQITTVAVLDYEAKQFHEIVVQATDQGANPRIGTTTVRINVNDLQDEIPRFTNENYQATILETAPVNSLVVQVTAMDPDTQDSITYKFLSGNFAPFSIQANDGRITTNAALDFETTPQYIFTVTTQQGEGGGLSSTATVTVDVVDQNDFTPVISITPSGSVTVLETAGVGSELVRITATDGDPPGSANSDVTISIASVVPNSGNNLFYIDPKSPARLVISQALTGDSATQYTVTVSAVDGGASPNSASTTITVNVIRNTAPSFSPTFTTININSNQPTGTIGTFVAMDSDTRTEFNTLTYSLIPDNRVPNLFQIQSGGVLRLQTSLLSDDSTSYILTVIATDPPGLSATGTVTVNVTRNLHDPVWVLQNNQAAVTVEILETKPLLESVVRIRATDADTQAPYNTLTYTIVGDSTAQSYFRGVKQGGNQEFDLQLIRSPADNQNINTFSITVAVADGGNGSPPQNFVVTVNVKRNQAAPLFFNQTYYKEISEELNIGQEVLTVQANDADTEASFRTITYSIAASSDHGVDTYFSIVPNTGRINVKAGLAGSNSIFYNFIVQASDGSRTANAYVTIKILRNLQTPSFVITSHSATILETQQTGVAINLNPANFDVNDGDRGPPNNQINYRLLNNLDHFQITPQGVVSVKNSLVTSNPRSTSYQLSVQAYDLGDPSRSSSNTATITVNVIRNQAPVIQAQNLSPISETTPVSTNALFTVQATDADTSPEFNVITYSIYGPTEAFTYFTIDSTTGAVTLRQTLTGTTQTTFQIFVRATDNGFPALSDTEVFTLTVQRNLNPPQFAPLTYTAEIREDQQVGTGIGVTVMATDADNSEQSRHWEIAYKSECILEEADIWILDKVVKPQPDSSNFVTSCRGLGLQGSVLDRSHHPREPQTRTRAVQRDHDLNGDGPPTEWGVIGISHNCTHKKSSEMKQLREMEH